MPSEGSNAQEESQHSTEETEDTGASGREAEGGNSQQMRSANEIPDVTLDVPTLNLEEAHLQVENLRARISLQSELADMVRINVGVDAFLEKVELDLKGLEAQALLKANLENVRDILVRTLESLDNNPDLVENLAQQAGDSGKTLEGVAGDVTGEASQEDGESQESDEENAGEIEATDAARRKADELGVELGGLEGSGSGGRIIVKDVVRAARQG